MTFDDYLSARRELEEQITNLDLNCQLYIKLDIGNLKDLIEVFKFAYSERNREVESLTRVIKRTIGEDFFKYIGGKELEDRFE